MNNLKLSSNVFAEFSVTTWRVSGSVDRNAIQKKKLWKM
jgi:hypothetical protein